MIPGSLDDDAAEEIRRFIEACRSFLRVPVQAGLALIRTGAAPPRRRSAQPCPAADANAGVDTLSGGARRRA